MTAENSRAEGLQELTNDSGVQQLLRGGTQLYVDIVDPSVETIGWIGTGDVTLTDPQGLEIVTLQPGDESGFFVGAPGPYGVYVHAQQTHGVPWDVQVLNATDNGGRLHSYNWTFNLGSYSASNSTYASFYSLVSGGQPGKHAVVELALDGLSGYVYNLNANRIGVDGPARGQSVPSYGESVTSEFAIYLAPPSIANYGVFTPTISSLNFSSASQVPVVEDITLPACNQFLSTEAGGHFQFITDVDATYNLQCDLNNDGIFDATSPSDLLVIGTTLVGPNTIDWDGKTSDGSTVSPGTYDCRVSINIGEFHYVGYDIETSFPGMRIYEYQEDGTRVPLAMYWSDHAVQSGAVQMPNGETSLVAAGPNGMDPQAFDSVTLPNTNARSWGRFTWNGKGNNAYLDTYTWVTGSQSSEIEIVSADSALDTDGDGLSDYDETCKYGTSPDLADTDGNGVSDRQQYPGIYTTQSTRLHFEDMLGVGENDWDYNDFIVDIDTRVQVDEGVVQEITLVYTPLARGAGYYHRFHQGIPNALGPWTATILSGGQTTVVQGTGAVDLVVYEDTALAFTDAEERYSNTWGTALWNPPVATEISIVFDQPANLLGDLGALPFDPYLELPFLNVATPEIHLSTTPVFETVQGSGPLAGYSLPFVFSTQGSGTEYWPCEGTPIWYQFARFSSHIQGGIGSATASDIFVYPTTPELTWSKNTPSTCGN